MFRLREATEKLSRRPFQRRQFPPLFCCWTYQHGLVEWPLDSLRSRTLPRIVLVCYQFFLYKMQKKEEKGGEECIEESAVHGWCVRMRISKGGGGGATGRKKLAGPGKWQKSVEKKREMLVCVRIRVLDGQEKKMRLSKYSSRIRCCFFHFVLVGEGGGDSFGPWRSCV